MKRYKDAFTPVPAETLARVDETLRSLPAQEKQAALPVRRRWAVAVAIALVLTLCGGAVAAERLGVLDFLFGLESTTEEQQQLVQNVSVSQETAMATVTVTDAIFDGRALSVGFVFDTDRPTYALCEGLWLNGTLVNPNDVSAHFYWVNQEDAPRQTSSGLTAIAGETLAGQVEARLRVMLLQPRQALEIIDENSPDRVETARQALEAGLTPIESNRFSFASLDSPRPPYPDTETDYPFNRDSLAHADMYNMNVEEVWLTFTVEADAPYTGETIYLDVANNDELPFTVVVRRAELTLVGSHFVLDFYPKAGELERPADLNRIVSLIDRFYDGGFLMLEFQITSTNYGYSGWMTDAQGRDFYRWTSESGPIRELPEKVYLVFDSVPSFRPLWQWAIELCPTDEPVSRDIPMAESRGVPGEELPFYFHYSDATTEGDVIRCMASLSSLDGTSDYQALWRKWEVRDLSGNLLEMGTGQTRIEESDDGGEIFVITQDVVTPEEIPDAVYLIPVDPDTGEANPDLALMLPVAQE